MKYASQIFGDALARPMKASSKKLSLLDPGQIVRTVDGSAYRVSSKTASPKGIAYKLADLSGKPVPTPANFRPVGLAMSRFASWLRYHLAYNKDFDLYVNSYIEKFNTEHPEGPLPYPAGPDGKPFRWADWFQRNIASKLYVNVDPGQAQAMKDEVIHEMLFTVLGQRHAIDKFAKKIKRFNKNDTVKNMSVDRQLTVYLTTIFSHKHRLMEMQGLLKEQQPEQEMSMWQPGMGEEGDEGSEQNILDTEQYGVGKEEFESAEAQKDIAKFRDGFGHWLKSKYSDKVATSFLTLFDIYWNLISQSGSDEVQDVEKSDKQKKKEERKSWMVSRADLMPLWAERTGLSEGSMKDYLGRLPGLMEEYITSHAKELGESNIFVSLMNEIKKENKKSRPAKASVTASDEGDIQKQMDAEYKIHGKSEKWFKLRDQQTTRHPKMAKALKLAEGVEGDFSQALKNTENPDVVDHDIKQPTQSVSEAAGVKQGADKTAAFVLNPQCSNYKAIVERVQNLNGGRGGALDYLAELEKEHFATCIDCQRYNKEWMAGRQASSKTAKLIAGANLTPEMVKQVKDAFIYRWTHENSRRADVYHCGKCDVVNNPYVNEKSSEGHSHPTIPLISDDQWIREHAFHFTNDGRLATRQRHAEPAYLAQHNARRVASVDLKFAIEKAAYAPEEFACCGGQDTHDPNCSVKGTDSASKKTAWNEDEPVDMTDEYAVNKAQSKPPLEALQLYIDKATGTVHVAFDSEEPTTLCGTTVGHSPLRGMHENTMTPTTVEEVEEIEKTRPDVWCPHCLDEYDGPAYLQEEEEGIEKEGMLGHDFNNADGQAIRSETLPDTGTIPDAYDTTELKQPRVARGLMPGGRSKCKECGNSPCTCDDCEYKEGSGTQDCCGAFKPKHKENCKAYNDNFKRTTETLGLAKKEGAGSNSGKDDARGAGDNWREEFYESSETGPSADALGLTASRKTAQGSGSTTVTMQDQNATFPTTQGRGEPMAVPDAIDQAPGPHSPNAPATAPRTPDIQPRIVDVPSGTVDADFATTASEDADWESMHPSDEDDNEGLEEYNCPQCGSSNTEVDERSDGGYDIWCDVCDRVVGEQPAPQFRWHGKEPAPAGSDFTDEENEKFKTFMKSLGASKKKSTKSDDELMEEAEITLRKQGGEETYEVFVRDFWRMERGRRVPNPGADEEQLATGLTYDEARDMCEEWNGSHDPGELSRKCEFRGEGNATDDDEEQSAYTIYGKYKGNTEEIDTAEDLSSAEYLVGEYKLAYGKDWEIWYEGPGGERGDMPAAPGYRDLKQMREMGIRGSKEAAAVAPTTVSPNVVQNQNINRPVTQQQQNPVSVALMPGQEQQQDQSGSGYGSEQPSKRTIMPELAQNEFLMRESSLHDLVASEMIKLGGGTDFWTTGRGKTVEEAFSNARREAQYESGHGGYSGTIAEKNDYAVLRVPAGIKPGKYAELVAQASYMDEKGGLTERKRIQVKPGMKCPKCKKGKIEMKPEEVKEWPASYGRPAGQTYKSGGGLTCAACGAKGFDLYSQSEGHGDAAKYYTFKSVPVKLAPEVLAQLKRDGEVFNDKFGPAAAVQLKKNEWLFFGIASS